MPTADSSPLQLFRQRPFAFFWFARVFTAAGSQMQAVAVSWQIYELTHSAFDLGMVGLVQFLPRLALMTVAGNAADRYDRRASSSWLRSCKPSCSPSSHWRAFTAMSRAS